MNVTEIAAAWLDPQSVEPLGQGHIHNTYIVRTEQDAFVLQRVNEAVFTDTKQLMEQTQRVLTHWAVQSHYRVPALCRTKDRAVWFESDGLWRMWTYLDRTQVIDPIENPAQAEAAGRAFGQFQAHMSDLPGIRLGDTIEGFLQLAHYLSVFDEVADTAPKAERKLIDEHRAMASVLAERNAYIHGDCKVNNLLFAAGDAACVEAVIDFDTVMFGHWAWDFGDLVRSVAFSRGAVAIEDFAACLRGFAAAQPLADAEEAVQAPGYIALMLGVRFLTDHLTGNHYFRVQTPGDNLARAREQFALFAEFKKQEEDLLESASSVLAIS